MWGDWKNMYNISYQVIILENVYRGVKIVTMSSLNIFTDRSKIYLPQFEVCLQFDVGIL